MIDGSENEHLDLRGFLLPSLCRITYAMLTLSLYPDHELASGFDLKDGYVKFYCPRVDAGSNYIVVCTCLAQIVTYAS